LLAFAGTPADLTLLETGLGGRLDATNVVARPKLTAITAISYDHQGYLGETLAQIAFEKAGILKPGVACLSVRQAPEAADVLRVRAAEVGASLAWEGQAWSVLPKDEGLTFADGERNLHLPSPALPGAHQVTNAGLAIACAVRLLDDRLDPAALAEGLRRVQWPARLQRLVSGALAEVLPAGWELWLDGGHNPGAAEVLARHLQQWRDRPICLVVGMLKSKDVEEFMRPLAPLAHRMLSVAIPGEDASLSANAIASVASRFGVPAEPAASVRTALKILTRTAVEPARVLICGSLYLAGTVLKENQR
jgi:dihydrofolate synthase/folylpolyglutamate synthase